MGGNKTRKLEFLLGDALAQGADTVITHGAVQSNHTRQTAAAASKLGMACEILLERRVPDVAPDYEATGNVFLDRLYGAELSFHPDGTDMNGACLDRVEQMKVNRAAQRHSLGSGVFGKGNGGIDWLNPSGPVLKTRQRRFSPHGRRGRSVRLSGPFYAIFAKPSTRLTGSKVCARRTQRRKFISFVTNTANQKENQDR